MKREKKDELKIIGLKRKTGNKNGQSLNDIAEVWNEFMSKNIATLEKSMINHGSAYGVYFEYEGDYMQPYSFLAGVAVEKNTVVPDGLDSVILPQDVYTKFITEKLPLSEKMSEVWGRIWDANLQRKYGVDYEEYNYTKDPDNPEVAVYIGTIE